MYKATRESAEGTARGVLSPSIAHVDRWNDGVRNSERNEINNAETSRPPESEHFEMRAARSHRLAVLFDDLQDQS